MEEELLKSSLDEGSSIVDQERHKLEIMVEESSSNECNRSSSTPKSSETQISSKNYVGNSTRVSIGRNKTITSWYRAMKDEIKSAGFYIKNDKSEAVRRVSPKDQHALEIVKKSKFKEK